MYGACSQTLNGLSGHTVACRSLPVNQPTWFEACLSSCWPCCSHRHAAPAVPRPHVAVWPWYTSRGPTAACCCRCCWGPLEMMRPHGTTRSIRHVTTCTIETDTLLDSSSPGIGQPAVIAQQATRVLQPCCAPTPAQHPGMAILLVNQQEPASTAVCIQVRNHARVAQAAAAPPTWVLVTISRHVAGPMRVSMLWLLLLLGVLVLLLALLGGPLVTVRQLGQLLLGTGLHIRVGEVVILQMRQTCEQVGKAPALSRDSLAAATDLLASPAELVEWSFCGCTYKHKPATLLNIPLQKADKPAHRTYPALAASKNKGGAAEAAVFNYSCSC